MARRTTIRPAVRWDWRISAHCRIASLASAWLLALGATALGPLLWPLGALRFVASTVQTWLNIKLGRREPIARQDRRDWALLALVMAGAYAGLGLSQLVGTLQSPVVYVPMLLPFTALQLRMTARSYRAHGQDGRRARVTPLLRRARPLSRAA